MGNGSTEYSPIKICSVKVFKFGGASVRDAAAVRNVLEVVKNHGGKQLMVVVSAMGKTTNALEEAWRLREQNEHQSAVHQLDVLIAAHEEIMEELFAEDSAGFAKVNLFWSSLRNYLEQPHSGNRDFEYDQIVSVGELVSTAIVSIYLDEKGLNNHWLDAREMIVTDNIHREARVDWESTVKAVNSKWSEATAQAGQTCCITQGFIGADSEGNTTTLGREGSDYTAAILAFALKAEAVTIWKDVPGVLNADPKYFTETKQLPRISFKEAIELSYFGASVIHPKTIKPLQNAGIPLYVRSFLHPEIPGTEIQASQKDDALIPSFIFKTEQVLISISPRDFSFIVEESLSTIFGLLAQERIHVNLMQHSALSFSICADRDRHRVERLMAALLDDFEVRYNEPVTLLTIRHYTEDLIDELVGEREILVEQRSRNTARFVVRT